MKTTSRIVVYLAVMALVTGCRRVPACTVTQYGSEYLTYTGSSDRFNDACREVLREFSYKEKLSDNSTQYPYYGEGGTTSKDGDRQIAQRTYLQTKDQEGAEYKITTVRLGKSDPIVMLESTSADSFKLINALLAEFPKRGIQVRQY